MAITIEQAIEAAKGSGGFVTEVAKRLGCSRNHVHVLRRKWVAFENAFIDEKEKQKDFAEGKLLSQIKAGNMTGIIFYLKTQAKDRGYIERQEITGAEGAPILVVKWNDDAPENSN